MKDADYSCSEIGFLKAQLRSSAESGESDRLAVLQHFLELERQSKAYTFPDVTNVIEFPSVRWKLSVIKN